MPLNVEVRRVRLADGRRQEVNARFMRKEQYDRLVANIKRDGCLTSVPLWYQPDPTVAPDIISGHHRGQAAIEALGPDTEADVMFVLDAQSLAEIRARQISHNAINGEDDLATLKQMYEEVDDVDWRAYTGLDDKTLELLGEVDLSSLAEANLEFQTVQIMFLPHERVEAEKAFDDAKRMAPAEARFLAALEQHEPVLQALELARNSYSVGNIATALGVILEVFNRHLTDLQDGWYDESDSTPKHDKWIPLATIAGTHNIPAEAGAVILQAMKRAAADAELGDDAAPWRALELLAADYLAGA